MKQKLKEYIDNVFADAERRSPRNVRLAELKEELLSNLYEKYDDLLAAGKTPGTAYNIAISGVGDISALVESLSSEGDAPEKAKSRNIYQQERRPLTPEEEAAVHSYRQRSAILTSVAVALYILCWVPTVICSAISENAFADTLGVAAMFLMIAVATGLLIFKGMSKPKISPQADWSKDRDEEDDEDEKDRDDRDDRREGRSPVYKAISSALWILTVCGYLLVSFVTGAWHITWMMFLIATAIDNVIKAIFDLRR